MCVEKNIQCALTIKHFSYLRELSSSKIETKRNAITLVVISFVTVYSTSRKTSKVSEMSIQELNEFLFGIKEITLPFVETV